VALGGVTCDFFTYKSILCGTCKSQWIVIEEVSMIELALWNFLQRLKFMGVKYILLGDMEQNGPCGGHVWAGEILPEDCVIRSPLLQILADNNRMILSENKRSDALLFDFYTSLVPGGCLHKTPLEDVLKFAKEKFPKQPGWPAISLVIPHKERKRINAAQNKATKPNDAVLVEGEDGPMWLHLGLKLVAHLCGKQRGVCNSAFYTILSLGETVRVLCELTTKELDLTWDFVKQKLRLAYSITQASCQGTTLRGRVRIYDHPRLTRRGLYVCSSRATAANLLEVI
jgi:hypothetical protein